MGNYSIFENSKKKLQRFLSWKGRLPSQSFPASTLPKKVPDRGGLITVNALAIISNPQYFVVRKNCKKKTPPQFKSIGEYVYEIQWGLGELANPDVDPVGVFGYSGNRRYIWQNKFWAELDIAAFYGQGGEHMKIVSSWHSELISLVYPLNEEFNIS